MQSLLCGLDTLLSHLAGRGQSGFPLGIPLLDALLPAPKDLRPGRAQLRLVFLGPDIGLADRLA